MAESLRIGGNAEARRYRARARKYYRWAEGWNRSAEYWASANKWEPASVDLARAEDRRQWARDVMKLARLAARREQVL